MAEATTAAAPEAAPSTEFTTRERDVYELICGGLATRAIARRLHISPKTVETHRMRINKKLKTHSTREIILRRIVEIGEDIDGGSDSKRLAAILVFAKHAIVGSAASSEARS
jgi:DNA-binding NarL/FixJ family response regulator